MFNLKRFHKFDKVICKVYKNENNDIYGIKVKNHTKTDVCIIVSTCTINLINSIESLTDASVKIIKIDEKEGIISFVIPVGKSNKDVKLLLDSYLLALKSLKLNYPKYINVVEQGGAVNVES